MVSIGIDHPTDMSYLVSQGLLVSTQIVVTPYPNCIQSHTITFSIEISGESLSTPSFIPNEYLSGDYFAVDTSDPITVGLYDVIISVTQDDNIGGTIIDQASFPLEIECEVS